MYYQLATHFSAILFYLETNDCSFLISIFYFIFFNNNSSYGVQIDYIDLYYPLFCFSFWFCISLYLINFNFNLFICNCWWVEFKTKANYLPSSITATHSKTWQKKYNFLCYAQNMINLLFTLFSLRLIICWWCIGNVDYLTVDCINFENFSYKDKSLVTLLLLVDILELKEHHKLLTNKQLKHWWKRMRGWKYKCNLLSNFKFMWM